MSKSKFELSDIADFDVVSVRETSRRLGVAHSAVHERFNKWVDKGYLIKVGHKYRVNFAKSRKELPLADMPNCYAYIESYEPILTQPSKPTTQSIKGLEHEGNKE